MILISLVLGMITKNTQITIWVHLHSNDVLLHPTALVTDCRLEIKNHDLDQEFNLSKAMKESKQLITQPLQLTC